MKGPMRPFAGLCVAFLLLLREDRQWFAPQLGDKPRAYQVGSGHNNDGYGLFSITSIGGINWIGYKDVNHRGFNKGYYYTFFYFKNDNTLHGFINNLDLQSDDAHPHDVSEASEYILFGQKNWHYVETLEVHWVVWGSPHNKGAAPSRSLKDKLFQADYYGQRNFGDATIFEIYSGTVITIEMKYQKNTNPKKSAYTGEWICFSIERFGVTKYSCVRFPECKDVSAVYTFRLNIMDMDVAFFCGNMVKYLDYKLDYSSITHGLHLIVDNAKPLRFYIETMGHIFPKAT
ncbi:uncharacterized protein [Dermacentor albipictus]